MDHPSQIDASMRQPARRSTLMSTRRQSEAGIDALHMRQLVDAAFIGGRMHALHQGGVSEITPIA